MSPLGTYRGSNMLMKLFVLILLSPLIMITSLLMDQYYVDKLILIGACAAVYILGLVFVYASNKCSDKTLTILSFIMWAPVMGTLIYFYLR